MENKIIELKNITKRYGDFTAVDNLNLYIRKGEFVTLLGPSGCGKTTTLRMIAGFEMPDEGEVLFNGKDISEIPPYKRNINTVFQRYALFPHYNVFNNIAFGLKLKTIDKEYVDKKGVTKTKKVHLSKAEIAKKVKNALKIVGLSDYEERDVSSLSGGQQQRVAIARAIVNEPEILLLDEPLGALDLKMRKDMQLELKAMHKKLGITFIYVTHDQEEALTMSDTIVVMKDGEIQQIGTPIDIYNEPKNAFVADFIGESNIVDGIMKEDFLVEFDNVTAKCTDKGFGENERVDVVIRPEDFYITDPTDKGLISGKIISSVFKGMDYEMEVKSESGCEFLVKDTKFRSVGSDVSLFIDPDDIHIMKKMHVENDLEGVISDINEIELSGGYFPCDTVSLANYATLDEDGRPLDENGDLIDLKGRRVRITIPFNKIELTDDEEDGIIGADVITILFKGNHYQYGVKTDTNDFFYCDSLDQWDDGDRVGIKVRPEDITLELLSEVEE